MKFVINGKFVNQKTTGVQRYAIEIIKELDTIVKKEYISLAIPTNSNNNIPKLNNIRVIRIGKNNGNIWEQLDFPIFAKKNNLIPINLCGPSPLIYPGVVTLHDVTFRAFPQTFTLKFRIWYDILFKNSIKRAKKLVTISKFSENEIKKYYKNDRDFDIVSDAWQHFDSVIADKTTLERHGLTPYRYYFALGSLKPNKNLKWIAEVAKRHPNEKFVIAGSVNKENFKNGIGFSIPTNMVFIGYINDEESKELMKRCKCFLFPSLYEGFGIPPLEAMSSGCQSILAYDIPVMREVYGNSISYIEGFSLHSNKCNKDCLENYSWEKSAKKLAEVLMDL